jgi:hypothetical protein
VTTDLVQYQQQSELMEQMEYAKAVAAGTLLPEAYRNKPANVLIAVGLGSAMGLSPAESLYRIDVIQGKPTASAELIATNVRKAGHKLRVKGDDQSCTATIIRVDDPDFPFIVIRDAAWAQRMGLASKDNYKKQIGTMLQWRAITAVARLACPEALYGVAYTPDEIRDYSEDGERPQRVTAAEIMSESKNAPKAQPEPDFEPSGMDEFAQPAGDAPVETGEAITAPQSKILHVLLGKNDLGDRDAGLAYIGGVIGREIDTSKGLTKAEASKVIDRLITLGADPNEPTQAVLDEIAAGK